MRHHLALGRIQSLQTSSPVVKSASGLQPTEHLEDRMQLLDLLTEAVLGVETCYLHAADT